MGTRWWISTHRAAGLERTLIAHGATHNQARQISTAMLEICDLEEIEQWLDEPGIEGGFENGEEDPVGLPEDCTPRQALEAGHGDYVVRVARAEVGL